MKKSIDSPISLWRALQIDAGLELRRSKGALGRDADLETALIQKFSPLTGMPAMHASLEKVLIDDSRLISPKITVESLIEAILIEQQGFAAMMSDILDTLVMANATNSQNTLSILFAFDKTSNPLHLTLDAFRQQVEKTQTVISTQWLLPKKNARWELLDNLASLVGGRAIFRRAPFPPIAAPGTAPVSGNQPLDETLKDLIQLAVEFCSECMKYGTDRKKVFQTVTNLFPNFRSDPNQVAVMSIAGDATDGWDINFVNVVQQIARAVKGGSLDSADTEAKITAWTSEMPSRKAQLRKKYNELTDVLNLPSWKKRHELYSVWVGTALLRTAKKHASRFDFHPVDGILSFAFGGSRLATYDWEGQQFDIWAEFRSDLTVKSEKRKKGIQPDFRVMKASIGGSDNAKTRFVLECKHYLKPSLSNFSQAASDYSKCCYNADVFIVNHGPADHDLLSQKLSKEIVGKVQFLGDMVAGAKKTELECAIGNILFNGSEVKVPPLERAQVEEEVNKERQVVGTIRLAWDIPLQDIDLSVRAIDCHGTLQREINFSSQGTLEDPPYAMLKADIREAPGAEQIDILKWHFDRYEIVATNFSGSPAMSSGLLRCTVLLGKSYEIIEFPTSGDGYAPWHIGTIKVIQGVPHLIDIDKGTSEFLKKIG